MAKYQALFTVELTISVEIEAANAEEAENQFCDLRDDGTDELINIGYVSREYVDFDSSFEPIKEPPAHEAKDDKK